jgi:ubiquitin C-terminal hydrolase
MRVILKFLTKKVFIIFKKKGSIDIGHYYSFIKKNNVWYQCSDLNINKVENIENMLNIAKGKTKK